MNMNKIKDETDQVVAEVSENNFPPPDNSKIFKPLTSDELIDILGSTIKRDDVNKLITFLALISAYTENSQINISFNAPSSSGKSYIPLEISKYFPMEDIIIIGHCSPTAFFHDYGEFDKSIKGYKVDLSRKIIVFLDQPGNLLLEYLRPVLSHDKKEIKMKITDKSQKHGLRTKNIILIGYPVVVFCTAGLTLDEQEATRFLLLSPDITAEKIREAILEKIKKEANQIQYQKLLNSDPKRKKLIRRIKAIREEDITEIKIEDMELVKKLFFDKAKILKPRHQRDIGRVISLIKSFALLNIWHRKRSGSSISVNKEDIKSAFNVWEKISEAQELNLPPYLLNLYRDVILTAHDEKYIAVGGGVKTGLSKKEILEKHFKVYGRFIPEWQLRHQILPMLETSGLITQESDPSDKRRTLVYPTSSHNISESGKGGDAIDKNKTAEEMTLDEVKEIFEVKD